MRKRRQAGRQRSAGTGLAPAGVRPGVVARLLREPLVHFLLLGAILFGLWTLLHPAAPGDQSRISVSAADVQRLRVLATRQWGREPDPQALAKLLEADIREQVLYREALAAGLDRDDVIIRRRLAQKIESLVTDPLPEPDEATLQAYWQQHFAGQPAAATLTLQQKFFSRALRGAKAADDARAALALVERGADAGSGDALLLPASAEQQTQTAVARDYGAAFAQQVFSLPEDRWQGPVESALGLHLVRISARAAPRARPYAEVREQVRQDYARQALGAAQDAAYGRMRARYRIEIAPDALPPAAAAGSAK